MDIRDINNLTGDMDIFLLDLILKGKVPQSSRVLDAGCGTGRNLVYFLNERFDVSAIDFNDSEVAAANFLSRSLIQREVAISGDMKKLPFDDQSFDFIICSRVLHFANSVSDFTDMLSELKRVLNSKGILYMSMASSLGMEERVKYLEEGKVQFPNGSVRFSLTEQLVEQIKKQWIQDEFMRTVIFDQEHAESTLVLRPV